MNLNDTTEIIKNKKNTYIQPRQSISYHTPREILTVIHTFFSECVWILIHYVLQVNKYKSKI